MSQLRSEIHFHAQDVVSVLVTSDLPEGREETAAHLALFSLVAARQIANLPGEPSTAGLATILGQLSADTLPSFAEYDRPGEPALKPYQGAPGRVRFTATLNLETFRFRLDAKGMGVFAKGAGYYAPHSVIALLRHLASRHRGDVRFLEGLAAVAGLIGTAGKARSITLTSQASLALAAWKAGLVIMEGQTHEPAGATVRLTAEEHAAVLRTIYDGGCRFIAGAAQYALQEAADAAAEAGTSRLGHTVADLGAAARLTAKRMPAHVAHFSEELGSVAAGATRGEITGAAQTLLRVGATITSNDEFCDRFDGVVTPVSALLELCDAAGREGGVPCLTSYQELWSIAIPKLQHPPAVSLAPLERRALAAALRCLISLTEASATLVILAQAYKLLEGDVPGDLVSSGELLQENVAATCEALEGCYDESMDDVDADLVLDARLRAAHLGAILLQPMLWKAGAPEAREPFDIIGELKEHKDKLVEGAVLVGDVASPTDDPLVDDRPTGARPSTAITPWATQPVVGPCNDLGPAVLDRLHDECQIDHQWCVRQGRSLTWWSHRLSQTIQVDHPRLSLSDANVAARAVVALVTDVSADDETIRKSLVALNRTATFGALVYDASQHTILQSTTAYFHSGNADVQRVFFLATMLGNYEAHGRADGLAALVGGRPADSAHPISGTRPLPDGMLMLGEDARRVGQEPSRYRGPVLGALPESPYVPWVMANGDDEDFTGELAFLHDVPAMVAAMTGRPAGTALIQISTGTRHPAYGSGALMVMRLPLRVDETEAEELACGLNRAEAFEWTGFPQWGAWSTSPTSPDTLVHAVFLPNYAAVLGLFPIVAFYESLRCGWASERLTGPGRYA